MHYKLFLCFLLKTVQGDLNLSTNNKSAFLIDAGFSTNFSSANTEDLQKPRLCLKNADKCIGQDGYDETTTKQLSSFMMATAPPFDLSEIEGVTNKCRMQSQMYIKDLKRLELWALKMYDSSAKFPSGILSGNVNQFGNFDSCLQTGGKYCLTSLQVEPLTTSTKIFGLQKLIQSHFHFKSQLDDPGHRVPRYSTINWALCVPNGCTPKDVELGVVASLDKLASNTGLQVRIQVDPEMCQTENRPIPTSTILVSGLFVVLVGFVVLATIYDFHALGEKNEWIVAFSLQKNCKKLCQVKEAHDDIQAIHGIRFLNACLLIFAHKSMAMFFSPYTNRTEMVEFVSRPWTVLGRAASLYTDPFILISGTLSSYSLLGKLYKHGSINIAEEYVSRLFRIIPTFAALIAFCTFILPWMGAGPLWNQVVSHHSEICKKYWWRNLLFIHNYFGFKDMCLTHTHHVGIDTQLFFVSPFFVFLLWKAQIRGAYILGGLALASTGYRYYVTYTMKLSNYIHFGTSIKQLFDTADNMYILPVHRATVYLMGVLLGYILRNSKRLPLGQKKLRIGNSIALLCFMASFLGPAFMGSIDYTYNPTHAAWYAAFAPILWCYAFAWIIFTSHIGHRGGFERFFSWPKFSIWTKISYTIYLTQFPVFFYNVGSTRTSQYYSFFPVLINVHEILWIVVLSIILTLLVEMPFHNLRTLVFRKPRPALHMKTS